MTIHKFHPFHKLWAARQALAGGRTTLSAAEQTRLSWAQLIETYEAVPAPYQDFFASFQASGQPFPYTVLTPTFEGYLFRTAQKLICDCGAQISILEKSGETYFAQSFPLAEIRYLEMRTILLDSRLKLCGLTSQGQVATVVLRFNTVSDFLLKPLLRKIRLSQTGWREPAYPAECENFAHWAEINYKFVHYAGTSLLGDEKVLQAILQPEIRARCPGIFGAMFSQTISLAHAAILTDRELIMICEEQMAAGAGRYGGAWKYFPLTKITALAVDPSPGGLLRLSILLPENERHEFLFEAAQQTELEQLLTRFQDCLPENTRQ